MPNSAPRIIVVNQTVTPHFSKWLGVLAEEYGPVELWSGNAPSELPGVQIRRVPAYDRSSEGSRLRTWLHFACVVLWALIRRRECAPLFVTTNPPFMPLAAWLLRKCQGRPFGALEWDIYPDILVPLGYAKPHHSLYRLWRKWHSEALRAADLIVTIGEHMADALRTMAGALDLRVTVVPNWSNPEWIWPRPRVDNPFAQEQKLDDRLTVLYSGNLGTTHAIEAVVAVAERLREDGRIHFLIVGEGSKQPLVEAAIKAGRTPTLNLLPWQPAAALPFVLASADIGIVTLAEGYERLSMPSKTYSLMAAGSALLGISRAPNDLAATIAHYHCGANFEPTAVEAIASWVQSLAADRSRLEPFRRQARLAAVEHFSATNCQALLNQAIGRYLLSHAETYPAQFSASSLP
jgi:glycosyltransferase involved in cell wall biosynthesis